jgi:hypothetical protein
VAAAAPGLPAAKGMPRHGMPYAGEPCAMPNQTPAVEYALHQLEPLLDAYCEGEVDLTDVTHWLSSYEVQLGDRRDEQWAAATVRIWGLLSELENGYSDESAIHRGLAAIARDLGTAQ